MAITTDTARTGLIDGMQKGITGSMVGLPQPVIYTHGSPDSLTEALGSQIAQDVDNDELYMCETNGNTDWVHLISGT